MLTILRVRPTVKLLRLALLISGVGSIQACAFRTQTTGMAVDYNEFIAQTTNRQTVLNILRAREREPMHFSSLGEILGTVRGQSAATLGGAFNGDSQARTTTDTTATNTGATGALTGAAVTATRTIVDNVGGTNITPSMGIQVNTGTDFKVAANTTDDFYKGILTPVTPSLIVHYLRQGFPSDLLSHLLIGRLEYSAEITPPGGASEKFSYVIENRPHDPLYAGPIASAIRCLPLDYAVKQIPAKSLPITNLAALAPISPDILKQLQATKNAKGKTEYELVTPAQTNVSLLLASGPDEPECDNLRQILLDRLTSETTGKSLRQTIGSGSTGSRKTTLRFFGLAVPLSSQGLTGTDARQLETPGAVKFAGHELLEPLLPHDYKGELSIDVTLRSVEGILYYLGEYIRDQLLSPKLAGGHCAGYCLPIIRVEQAGTIPRESRFVEVTYRGVRYAVPITGAVLDAEAGRSSQTVDLVEQLLNLNRSSKDLPTTPIVHVVN